MPFGREKLIVPDTSILISRKLTELFDKGELKKIKLIIPELVVDELQAQANKGKEIGFLGLNEIKELRKRKVKMDFVGKKATMEDIKLAKKGRIDALIRDVAKQYKAILYTRDLVQALVAEVFGVEVIYIKSNRGKRELTFLSFLTKNTMSLHFKLNCEPFARRGKPGEIKTEKLRKNKLLKKEFESIASSILMEARRGIYNFVEFEEYGATVLQVRNMRIAITRPPFSSAEEITIFRPIVKLSIEDYKLSDELKKKIIRKSEGILIAGSPGSGKSTFAGSLAEFYNKREKIVKTMESPRDLQVGPGVTQYAPLAKEFAKTAEILLLVRPDYIIFDEVRNLSDFKIFADMRLAGIGMLGVVNASTPIDSIQRFIAGAGMGKMRSIIDTIIFMEDGKIKEILSLNLKIKVPTGMKNSELSRPLIEARNFETGKLEYEIYTFGNETVAVPMKKSKEKLKNKSKIGSKIKEKNKSKKKTNRSNRKIS